MTAAICANYRNPMNDFVGRKHHHKDRFRQRQSSRSAFYQPGLVIADDIEIGNGRENPATTLKRSDPSSCCSQEHLQQQQQQQQQQESEQQPRDGNWYFRPSALQYDDYGEGNMSVAEIVDMYVQDNERATREGVAIPQRPTAQRPQQQRHQRKAQERVQERVRDALFSATNTTTNINIPKASSSSSSSPSSTSRTASASVSSSASSPLRCLQWNIQAFTSPKDERNMHNITAGIIRAIFDTDSDVLVLNEIHWRDGHGYDHERKRKYKAMDCSQALLEEVLRLRGYHFSLVADHGDTPTMIATRKKVLRHQEIVLSNNRSALCLLIDCNSSSSSSSNNDSKAWVVGTHLDAFDAEQRRSEIRTLLMLNNTTSTSVVNDVDVDVDIDNNGVALAGSDNDSNNNTTATTPVILMGDFNQQRSQDYTDLEWKRISDSANMRNVPRDDGVSRILEANNFRCILDDVNRRIVTTTTTSEDDDDDQDENDTVEVKCNWNWNKKQPPPSTHWSGTTIDYTYYYNANENASYKNKNNTTTTTTTTIAPHGVYVSPVGFSDHRMTVTDWNVNVKTTRRSDSNDDNNSPQPRHIDKSFFFHHLPEGRHHSWLYNDNYNYYLYNKNNSEQSISSSSSTSTITSTSSSTTSLSSLPSSNSFSSSEFSTSSSNNKSGGLHVEDLKGLFRLE